LSFRIQGKNGILGEMKTVIAGAGETGVTIARLLSEENNDVVLIDQDSHRLQSAAQDLDIATRVGSATDWELLEELMELGPDLFVALTEDDETNLIGCSIAKELGYPQTAARVRKWKYLNPTRVDFGRIFAIDQFVSPELLAAEEIYKYVASLGTLRMESFAHGTVQMRTMRVPRNWKRTSEPLAQLPLPDGVMVGLIYRREGEQHVIFPHGRDALMEGDEVTFLGRSEAMEELHEFFGIPQEMAESALIVGGGLVGASVGKRLADQGVDVRIVDKDRNTCAELADTIPKATIIHRDASDLKFLRSEKVDQVDVVIITTHKDEVNTLISLLAKEAGAEHLIALIGERTNAEILREQGISHLVSTQENAANRVMALARPGAVVSTASYYDNRARVVEMKISMTSEIVGIPLSELGPHLPRDFLFGVIQNRGRTMVARGNRILCPGDTVILFTHPRHMDEIFRLF
jgi:trk/ktr system potassium uptake protein